MGLLLRNPAISFATHRSVPWFRLPPLSKPHVLLPIHFRSRLNGSFTTSSASFSPPLSSPQATPPSSSFPPPPSASSFHSPPPPPPPPPPPKRPRPLRRILTITLLVTASGILILLSPTLSTLYSLLSAPSSSQSLLLFNPTSPTSASIDTHILTHPLAQSLRADPAYIESRPHLRFPEALRIHSLTAGTLAGPGRIVVPPLTFSDENHGRLVSLTFLGEDMCGHVGIVHGGLLATLLDEGMALCGMPALPSRIGVTARLTIDYRKPVRAGTYIVLKAEVVKVEGRKVWVKGRIEGLEEKGGDGELLVEAEALFIQPKYAKSLPKLLTVKP